MDLNLQIRELYGRLREELEYFPRGAKFYSVRKLIEKFNTNRRVVDGVLSRMESENLLRKVPRVGYFSNFGSRSPMRNILLLRVDYPSDFWDEWIWRLQKAFEESGRYRLTQQFFAYDRPFFQNLDAKIYDAVLVMRGSYPLQQRELQSLNALNIPIVLLDCDAELLSFSSIGGDHHQGGMLAADYLIRRGHREILVVNPEPETGNIRARLCGFFNYAHLQGVTPRLLDCHTQTGERGIVKCCQSLRSYLEEHGLDFTVLFVLSDSSVSGVYAALQDYGLRVPDDVSVMGYDGLKNGELFRPALTTVANDFDRLIHEVVKGLDTLFQEGGQFNSLIPLKIVERDSVTILTQP